MGKYSLDAFEQYPLTRLRPAVGTRIPGGYRVLELFWSRLEPEGAGLLPPPEVGQGKVLLRLHLDLPKDDMAACGFIRRMGACYSGGKDLAGVILTCGGHSGVALGQLAKAYAQAFENTFLLAEPDSELLGLCRKEGVLPGLLLKPERGILSLRRSIAQEELQRTWRSRPVYLEAGRALTGEEWEAAIRWHASGADQETVLGPQMALRRMMFPRDLTTGGPLPLRMWWQNLGTAPMYRDVHAVLALGDGENRHLLPVAETIRPGLGDTTLNTTLQLPQLPRGSYGMWVGLKEKDSFLPLAMDVPEKEGLYQIGQITLDDIPRPYLAALWEEQYPDGYYPLEDPAQPE